MSSDRNYINIPGHLKRRLIEAARDFRKEPTPSEKLLWEALRRNKLNGIRFRRQQPIGPFIVDFYAPEFRLIVEIDGAVHNKQREADQARQEILEALDMKMLRFTADQVEKDITGVLATIAEVADGASSKRSREERTG